MFLRIYVKDTQQKGYIIEMFLLAQYIQILMENEAVSSSTCKLVKVVKLPGNSSGVEIDIFPLWSLACASARSSLLYISSFLGFMACQLLLVI